MRRAGLALAVSLPVSLSLALGCTAEPDIVVVATRELGPVASPVDSGLGVRERGYSVYGWGRSVWAWGTTELAEPDSAGLSLRTNSSSSTLDLGAKDGLDMWETPSDLAGGPAELFALTAEEIAFNQQDPAGQVRELIWPLALVRDDETSSTGSSAERILVFYAKLRSSPGAEPARIGSSIAIWTELEVGPVRPALDASSNEPTLLFRDPEPQFGQAALVDGDRLYAYGCAATVYHPCKLARVELDAVFQRDAWEFWTGSGWSPTLTDASDLLEADTVFSVGYNPLLDRYLAYFGEGDSGRLSVRTAPAPTGPWSGAITLFEAPAPVADVLVHPEYRRAGGQFVVLSYRVGEQPAQLLEVELAANR